LSYRRIILECNIYNNINLLKNQLRIKNNLC